MSTHYGRSFTDTRLEDVCPCEKAACGLVVVADPTCDQHPIEKMRTIRQMHQSEDCPELGRTLAPEIEGAAERFFMELDAIASKHGLSSDKWLPRIDGVGSDEAYEEWVQETWEKENADV